jgi:hypothetical protein
MSFEVSRLTAALVPLNADLENRLSEFLRLTRELISSPLFKRPKLELQFTPRKDEYFTTTLEASVDYLQAKGTMTSFRQLWQDGEAYQFPVVRSRLRQHAVASNGPDSPRFIAWADELGKAYSDACRRFPDFVVLEADIGAGGDVVEHGPVRVERIIDNWINGDIAHSDPARRARIDAAGDAEMYAFALLAGVQEVTKVYVLLAQMAKAILDEPALRPQ